MSAIYSSKVKTSGGRNGHVESEDGLLNLSLSLPKSLGGTGKATNPEQLFAAGYASCFENAVLHIASQEKIKIESSRVEAEVSLFAGEGGVFKLALKLDLSIEGPDHELSKSLIEKAHAVCPYSNATRGNIDISISHNGDQVV